MNDEVKQSLSVLMDGEASERDLERVLKHLQDADIRATWARYHHPRHVRDNEAVHLKVDISGAVMRAIANDEKPVIKPVAKWVRMFKPAASFAVAASFFSAVLVGSQFYSLLGVDDAASRQPATGVSTVGMVNTLGGSAVRAGYATPALRPVQRAQAVDYNQLARQRLQRYMLPHTEAAALNAPRGMMSFARVTNFRVED